MARSEELTLNFCSRSRGRAEILNVRFTWRTRVTLYACGGLSLATLALNIYLLPQINISKYYSRAWGPSSDLRKAWGNLVLHADLSFVSAPAEKQNYYTCYTRLWRASCELRTARDNLCVSFYNSAWGPRYVLREGLLVTYYSNPFSYPAGAGN